MTTYLERFLLVAPALVLTLSLTGCFGNEPPPGPPSGSGAVDTPGPAPGGDPADTIGPSPYRSPPLVDPVIDCPLSYPRRHDYQASLAAIYRDIDVCSAGNTYVLKNNSEQVWVFEPGVLARVISGPFEAKEFRSAFPASPAFIVPGEVVSPSPCCASVTWAPDPRLTIAWIGHSAVAKRIANIDEELYKSILEGKGPYAYALRECAQTAAASVGQVMTAESSTTGLENLERTLKAGSDTAKCGRILQDMDKDPTIGSGSASKPKFSFSATEKIFGQGSKAAGALDEVFKFCVAAKICS